MSKAADRSKNARAAKSPRSRACKMSAIIWSTAVFLAGLPASQLQSTQPTAVRSPRGSATDPRRLSIRPRYTLLQQFHWLSVPERVTNSASWCIAVCMVSALNTSQRTSGSCPRFITHYRDCVRHPVPTLRFLPHAGLHLATAHFRSQEEVIEPCHFW